MDGRFVQNTSKFTRKVCSHYKKRLGQKMNNYPKIILIGPKSHESDVIKCGKCNVLSSKQEELQNVIRSIHGPSCTLHPEASSTQAVSLSHNQNQKVFQNSSLSEQEELRRVFQVVPSSSAAIHDNDLDNLSSQGSLESHDETASVSEQQESRTEQNRKSLPNLTQQCDRSRVSERKDGRFRCTSESVDSVSSLDSINERKSDLSAKFPVKNKSANRPDIHIRNKNTEQEEERKQLYRSNFRPIRPMPTNSHEILQDKYMKAKDAPHSRGISVRSDSSLADKFSPSYSYNQIKVDQDQVMAGSSKCNTLINFIPSTNSFVEDLQDGSNIRCDSNSSGIYFITTTTTKSASNSSPLSNEGLPSIKNSKDNVIEKNSKFLAGPPVVVQPIFNSNVYHKTRKKNVRNIYSTVNKTLSRKNGYGSGYESDVSEDDHLSQIGGRHHTSDYVVRNVNNYPPYSPTIIPKTLRSPTVQILPIHPTACKDSHLGCRGVHTSVKTKEPVNSLFHSQLEVSQKQSSPLPESLTLKQRQLAEKAEQLRIAEEVVKQQEEEAQVKTWQALKKQEALLKEKEESLKYREIIAQKKYEEAVRLLEESRKLSEYERIKDNQPVHIGSRSSHDNSLSLNFSLSDRGQIQCKQPVDVNRNLTNSPRLYSQPELRHFSAESQKLSDMTIGSEHNHALSKKIQHKHASKIGGRKPKKKVFTFDLCEVKPSIEPDKILRTYSRKGTKRQCVQSKVDTQSSSSPFAPSQRLSLAVQTDDIDVPVSARNIKEQVLVNESGTITITQLPKFDQPIRPYSALPRLHSLCNKRKSERFHPLPSLSYSLKKCPSRIETDSSPYSSSSDISMSFAEKVEKLTSSTNMQFCSQTSETNRDVPERILDTKPEISTIKQIPHAEASYYSHECDKKYFAESESYKIKYGNKSIENNNNNNIKGRLSMVTLQGVSFPGNVDSTNVFMQPELPKSSDTIHSLLPYDCAQTSECSVGLQTGPGNVVNSTTCDSEIKEHLKTVEVTSLENAVNVPKYSEMNTREEPLSKQNKNDKQVELISLKSRTENNLLANSHAKLPKAYEPLECQREMVSETMSTDQTSEVFNITSRKSSESDIPTGLSEAVVPKRNYDIEISIPKIQSPKQCSLNDLNSVSPMLVMGHFDLNKNRRTPVITDEFGLFPQQVPQIALDGIRTSAEIPLNDTLDYLSDKKNVGKIFRRTPTRSSECITTEMSDSHINNSEDNPKHNSNNSHHYFSEDGDFTSTQSFIKKELKNGVSYEKADKENILHHPSPFKDSAFESVNGLLGSQSVCPTLSRGFPSFLNRSNDENPHTNNDASKTSTVDENVHLTSHNKLALYNEGLQINNIQNIILDVKSINQTSVSFHPDSNPSSTNIKNENIFPTNTQVMSSASPIIQYDQRLVQCIINNTDQTIFYTPTIIYTTPPQNLVHSYATNTISSCSSSVFTDEKPQSISPVKSSKVDVQMQTDYSRLSIDSENNLVNENSPSQSECSEITENFNELNTEDVSNVSKPVTNEHPKSQESLTIERECVFKFNTTKDDFIQHNLPSEISSGNSNETSPVNEESKTCGMLSPSTVDSPMEVKLDDTKSWSNSAQILDFEETDTFKNVHLKETCKLNDNTSVICSSDIPENASEECTTDSVESINKINGVTSRGGRILKLKEWWPDIITDSPKKSTKTVKESRATSQKIFPDNEEQADLGTEPLKCKKRKRGRPKLKRDDGSYIEKCETDNIVLSTSKDSNCFECGKCNMVLSSQEEFQSHSYRIHSGLARIKGESQEFDDKSVYRILKVVLCKLKNLHCDVCSKHYKSVLGFKNHRKVCGKLYKDVYTNCSICSKDVLKTYIERHTTNHMHGTKEKNKMQQLANEDELQSVNEVNQLEDNNRRKKRKAANFCHDQMKLLYASIDTENDGSDDKDFESENNFKHFFNRNFNFMSPDSSEKFNENINCYGKSSCINVGCEASFTTLKKLKLHLRTCIKSDKYFTCKICNSTLKESEISAHIKKNHEGCMNDYSDYSSENEADLLESGISHDRIKNSCASHCKPFLFAKQMTLEFRKNNYSEQLYTELHCQSSDWVEIKDSEAHLYKSRLAYSPVFKFQENSTNNNPDSWDKMETFSGKRLGSGEVLFAGGPIRAAAWCPIPVINECVPQYIALASITDPDNLFLINKSEKHRGLIQIWNCGNLTESETPTLSLCIAHHYGVVWSMEWCPSGIYEKVSETSSMNRLGLLSAAFSDGTIRVYLIPHPHQIKSKSKIYNKVPDISLCPYNYENMELQCLKVSWCSSKGHSLIAGSFTNGMVCIWDLTNTSPLLTAKDSIGNTVLYPVNSVPAHNGVCSTVSFCPKTEGQHIVTGGSDRTIKFWDLTQPEHPITMIRKGIVTDSVWLPHWAGSFISFDDVFSLGKTSTTFRENGFYGCTYRAVMGTNATVWSIAGSDWLNALAQVDESGEVIVSRQHSLTCETASEKHMSKKRYPIFSVRLENLREGKVLSLEEEYQSKTLIPIKHDNSHPKEKSTTHSNIENIELSPEKFVEQPMTYLSTAEMYGIRIYDDEYSDFAKLDEKAIRSKQFSELMEPGPLTIYPLMGASSVAWNNNLGTHMWIFVGLNSGLGRIVKLSFLEKQ